MITRRLVLRTKITPVDQIASGSPQHMAVLAAAPYETSDHRRSRLAGCDASPQAPAPKSTRYADRGSDRRNRTHRNHARPVAAEMALDSNIRISAGPRVDGTGPRRVLG